MRAPWLVAASVLVACGGGDPGTSPDAGPDDADAGPCTTPLDQDTIDALTHSSWFAPVIEARPGDTRSIALGVVGLGAAFEPVPACATWSIAPATGASIDAATGVLTIADDTPSGTTYVVTADVEDGRKLIDADVVVYTPEAMPWQGTWRESQQLECGSGAEAEPAEVINEIRFWADGTLWVTWLPFEVYVDYWGTYAFEGDALTFAPDGGNYVPGDLDGAGTFAFEDDALVLRDAWFGSPDGGSSPARCGHVLIR